MRKPKIKFALELKDGQQARSIEELREFFDLEKIIGYFQDGKLVTWLEDRFYADEAEKIKNLSESSADFAKDICDILGADYEEIEDTETIKWRKERLERSRQYTADEKILEQIDWVAFDQEDLESIMGEKNMPSTVYLCQNTFVFPSGMLRKKDMRYVGIGKNVEVTVKLADNRSLSDLNISFENVTVHEVRVNTTANKDKSAEKADKSKENTSEWWKRTDFLSEAIYRLYSEDTSSEFIASWKKPIFLFDNTIKNIDRCRDFISRLYLQKDETLICIMPEMHVTFSNHAVYTARYVISSVKYSDIEDVMSLGVGVIKICKKNGSSDEFPCDRVWLRAMRRFLMLAADKRSILFENNNALYHMKFESLGGKALGQMLVS